jgi:hypothetical protein
LDTDRREMDVWSQAAGEKGVAAEHAAQAVGLDEAGELRRRPRVHHDRADDGDREPALVPFAVSMGGLAAGEAWKERRRDAA